MFCLSVGLCLAMLGGDAAAQTQPGADDGVKKTLAAWAATLTAGQVDRTVGFYENSPRTTAIESVGRVRHGIQQVRQMYEEAFREVVVQTVTLADTKVRVRGQIAWVTCRLRMRNRVRADDSQWILEVWASFVLVRQADDWVIALEHLSPIQGVPRVRRLDVEAAPSGN